MPPGGQEIVVAYGIGPDGRSLIPLTLDANGILQVSSGGGGAGGASTIADGSDVAEGATTSAESAAGNGTVIGILKNIRTRLANALTSVGPAANDDPVSGNPVRIGAHAQLGIYNPVIADDTRDIISDKYGRLIISPYAPVDQWAHGHPAVIAVNTAVDILPSSGASYRWYLQSVSVVNAHASVDTLVTIQDEDGTVMWRVWAKSGGYGEAIVLNPPIAAGAVNKKLQAICGTTGSSIYVDVSAFKAA